MVCLYMHFVSAVYFSLTVTWAVTETLNPHPFWIFIVLSQNIIIFTSDASHFSMLSLWISARITLSPSYSGLLCNVSIKNTDGRTVKREIVMEVSKNWTLVN